MLMVKQLPPSVDRRRVIQLLGGGGAAALAGCAGVLDDDDPDDDPPVDNDDDTADDDPPVDDEDDTDDPPEEPNDLERLVDVFDDQPFNDAQFEINGENRDYTPRHVWKFVSDESLIGLHFDEPNPEEASELDYITVGRKGVFTEESQPAQEFTHFHLVEADDWEAGHGGSTPEDEGYWLTHIAVREIQYPFHDDPISPRVDYEFMPTSPEQGSTGHQTDFESPGGDEGSLSAADRDALLEIFDDSIHNDAQHEVDEDDREYTPRHVWWEANEEVSLFLHFNEPNPEEATELDYFGIGVDAQFTFEDIPAGQDDEFTHFHLSDADDWEAGHGGGDVADEGTWLVHHSVREIEYPFHDEPIDVGVDRQFMPTPAPDAPDDIDRLVDIFDDQPFNDAQFEVSGENREYTPRHVWKFVSDESLIGLHFDDPNPEEASELDYITIGQKGVFSEESRPSEEFTHFHLVEADDWEAGHGGSDPDDEGYWLTHIAVRDIQYPFHADTIGSRVDYDFMPTPPEEGTTGHRTDFESPGGDEGSLDVADRDALLRVFDDQLHNDAQHQVSGLRRDYTPRHVWWQANDEVALFLHFNEPNPEHGTELDYFGIGVDGQFTAGDIPAGQDDEFTHFHLYDAEDWEAGHGGDDTTDEGTWLVHHAVRDIQYPFHEEPIGVSVDREFMPTPAPDA